MTTTRKTTRGAIEVKAYAASPYDAPSEGPALNELHVTESFTGGVVGQGVARMLQALGKDGAASFCAIERVEGTLDGRRGAFVLQDSGALAGTTVKGTWFVVPGSGTGELVGLRGQGTFEAELGAHAAYVLDYWFE